MTRTATQPQPTDAGKPNGTVPWLTVCGAAHNNLKNLDVSFPLGRFTCVTGVSGSGKSSLVNDILYAALARELNPLASVQPGKYERIDGTKHLDKVIAIDQSPIGRTPRSNPATYIKVFDEIRGLFTRLPDAKLRGYKPGRFSFNVAAQRGGGRCEACEGNGANRVEMDFLADVWVTCPVCAGARFTHETLQVHYKGKSIADVLEMDVQAALAHFENVPRIRDMLQTLLDVGLGYIKIGQPSTTLSGGEAQRIKLARELVKKATGRTLYVLDEPTTGLHFEDIRKLLAVLHGFVDAGNTVVVIEHNLDVVKTADWLIDLGPEGGEQGGEIVVEGTPEEVAACAASYTGQALREVLKNEELRIKNAELRKPPRAGKKSKDEANSEFLIPNSKFIRVVGARQHNLKDLTVSFPRNQMTVCTGVSGSGKTSFAIDTVFVEGYRRYVESLSAYARQFLGQLAKPRVDHVEGLSPAICIEQKAASKNPRSTVGTVTEIYDYMRVLWARVGTPYCTRCQVPVGSQTVDEIVLRIMALPAGAPIIILAPVTLGDGESYATLFNRLKNSGYTRVRIDGQIELTASATTLDARRRHRVEVVVDRTVVRARGRGRITESVEHALALGNGVVTVLVEAVETVETVDDGQQIVEAQPPAEGPAANETNANDASGAEPNAVPPSPAPTVQRTPSREMTFSQKLACPRCGTSYEELGPHHFSFNSPLGWCETCEGLGMQRGAPAAAILARPSDSLLRGAVEGWSRIDPKSAFGRMLSAFCRHIGVSPDTPLRDWTPAQKQALLFGTGAIAATSARSATPATIDAGDAFPGVRFRWRGFFPTIDAATRNSWMLRHRLHNLVTEMPCIACRGGRLRPDAAAVRLDSVVPEASSAVMGRTIGEICDLPLSAAAEFFQTLQLDDHRRKIAGPLLKEIRDRLQFLLDVGLEYLTLHRSAPTLSGGEAQRIRLASQIGSGLSGVLYVLDEPTIGLHPRDNLRLINALRKLRGLGNTLLLVEHDRDVIRSADRLLDFGPRAGAAGGHIVAEGQPAEFLKKPRPKKAADAVAADNASAEESSLTRAYLSGTAAIPIPSNRRPIPEWDGTTNAFLVVRGARQNNLKNIDVPIPLARFTCITGVSGSGKSSLVNDILWPALALRQGSTQTPGEHDALDGANDIDKIVNVDQAPIGSTPSSNPATYTGAFDAIRELFARLPESKMRGYNANRFSFNRPGGRCEACEGYGQKCIEMHFMPDVWVECETCRGQRYNPETLAVRFKGKNIADVLNLRVAEALDLFANVPRVRRMLQTLADVGLDYVPLGQPAPTLSGGEAQRVKLAAELGKPDTGRTFYILDEPTTGLHFDDVRKLLAVIHRLVDLGNTALVVEHHLDVIKCADWVIDLGPEAGAAGGYLVALGTPEDLISGTATTRATTIRAASASDRPSDRTATVRERPPVRAASASERSTTPELVSHTALALKPILDAGPRETRPVHDPAAHAARELEAARAGFGHVGAETKMPWQIDGRKWHLAQRTSRDGQPRRWDPAALDYVVDLVQQAGLFDPTNWNERASVEITAPGAPMWFMHALTGGEWLIELYFMAPARTFHWRELNDQLGLRTLDERDDLATYGDWARVDVRPRRGGFDAVVVYVHDKAEIDTPAFRRFIKTAARTYLDWMAAQSGRSRWDRQSPKSSKVPKPPKKSARKAAQESAPNEPQAPARGNRTRNASDGPQPIRTRNASDGPQPIRTRNASDGPPPAQQAGRPSQQGGSALHKASGASQKPAPQPAPNAAQHPPTPLPSREGQGEGRLAPVNEPQAPARGNRTPNASDGPPPAQQAGRPSRQGASAPHKATGASQKGATS